MSFDTALGTTFAETMPGISPGVYDADDFRAVSEIAHREAGIVLPAGKAMLVYSRLAPLVRDSGCQTFGAYIIRIREDGAERNRAISALTTNHTFFYREAHHFEHFNAEVRPRLIRRLETGGRVRTWSAGCSSGEETWSLLMTLFGPDRAKGAALARRDFRHLASDIASHALARAEAASYRADDVNPVPEVLRRAWVRPAGAIAGGDDVEIAPELRATTRFRYLNLHGPWPMTHRFDVIFCRNVMIYFDNPSKEALVKRFAEQLEPGGFLYIGHSERVTGPALKLLTNMGPTIYCRSAA